MHIFADVMDLVNQLLLSLGGGQDATFLAPAVWAPFCSWP